jgi:RecA-family ATPase
MNESLLNVATFDDRPPRSVEWLIDGILPMRTCGIIGGEPEAFKTWFALACAVSLASGRPLLRQWSPPRTGTSMVYSPEGEGEALRRRLYGLCIGADVDWKSTLKKIHVIRERIKVDDVEKYTKLSRTIAHYKPDLLIMDPLVSIHSADENNANEIQRVLDLVRDLGGVHNKLTILLVHHKNKGGSGSEGYSLRGSSAIYGWEDTLITIGKSASGEHNAPRTLKISHRDAVAPFPSGFTLSSYKVGQAEAYCLEPAIKE